MSNNISSITFLELLHVSSVVLIGAFTCHVLLLRIWRRIASHRKTMRSTGPHQYGYIEPYTIESTDVLDEKSSDCTKQLIKPQSKCRGLISKLPLRHTQIKEDSWQTQDKQHALHSLFVTCHEENEQFTYLGSKTFEKGTTSAQMFGWHRRPGVPTVQLGEIARLNVDHGKICLRVVLHPEDAQSVLQSGWGVPAASCTTARLLGNLKQSKGMEVELVAPTSEAELVDITKTVLDASVWWVAGAEKEDV